MECLPSIWIFINSYASRNLKNPTNIETEEHEANEFAGQPLMPEFIIYTCNFYSLERAAEYFMVSKTALWMRLNTMNRLDLLTSKRTRSCSCCGNMNFSSFYYEKGFLRGWQEACSDACVAEDKLMYAY